eukprot:SAG22_NODE_66_length_22936_cov_626.714279_5_plen_241_part_00
MTSWQHFEALLEASVLAQLPPPFVDATDDTPASANPCVPAAGEPGVQAEVQRRRTRASRLAVGSRAWPIPPVPLRAVPLALDVGGLYQPWAAAPAAAEGPSTLQPVEPGDAAQHQTRDAPSHRALADAARAIVGRRQQHQAADLARSRAVAENAGILDWAGVLMSHRPDGLGLAQGHTGPTELFCLLDFGGERLADCILEHLLPTVLQLAAVQPASLGVPTPTEMPPALGALLRKVPTHL